MVGRRNADVADVLHLSDDATATTFSAFYISGAHWRHLANTTEPSVRVQGRCGLMSNYFDHYCYY